MGRDVMVNWVNLVFKHKMGALVEQIKWLTRFSFLVIVRSFEEQQQILYISLLYMDGRIFAVAPWDIDLNSKPIDPFDFPI